MFGSSMFFLIVSSVLVVVLGNQDVSEIMEKNGVVPDILDVAPKGVIEVTYKSGVKVDLGNELTPTQVKDMPEVKWEANDNELYTLLFTDPDAPSRQNPIAREVRHWLVVNIPGNKVSEGKTLVEYIGSGPPKDSGLHRYIFLVFKQSSKIESDIYVSNTSRDGRLSTSTRKLITDYNLEPVAGNLYQAQYDDYVPILHEKLGGPPPKV